MRAEHRAPTPSDGEALLDATAQVVRGVGGATRVGIGAPGLCDRRGILHFAPNLPGVIGLDVAGGLRDRLGDVAVTVDNDASCAAVAEARIGAARGADTAILVTLGTGIGGGIVVGGTLLRGAHGYAGEIGHMVVDPAGLTCPCGKRGCWERYASGSALGAAARAAVADGGPVGEALLALAGGDAGAVRGEHVTEAVAAGVGGVDELLDRFCGWLALGLVNLTYAYDPDVIVLGGGLVEAGDVLLDPARAAFAERLAGSQHRPAVALRPAALGARAGAIGAALVAGDL